MRQRTIAILSFRVLFVLSFCLFGLLELTFAQGRVRVKGYTRKDGTYVSPHYRSAPDSIKSNNYSYPGNYNPNIGDFTPEPGHDVWVDSYTRSDGTYVSGHWRSAPGSGSSGLSTTTPTRDLRSPPSNISAPSNITNPKASAVPTVDLFELDLILSGRSSGITTPARRPPKINSYQAEQEQTNQERAAFWKERGYNFDPTYMTAYSMDRKVQDIERAKYWQGRGYSFDSSYMTAYSMDRKVEDIERAKYWKQQGYSFDASYMTAYAMDRKVEDIERAKFWKARGYDFDPSYMTAYAMDRKAQELQGR